jgi:peptidylprolyl isomerase
MTKPVDGQTVSVEYTGKLEDGTVFDSNVGGQPLNFVLGQQQVIPGFEDAVREMEVGASTEATIPPENAYGQPREELIITVDSEQFPDDMNPEVGMGVQLQSPQGQPIPAVIAAVEGDEVTLDANHQLAGKTLVFDIKLLGVE